MTEEGDATPSARAEEEPQAKSLKCAQVSGGGTMSVSASERERLHRKHGSSIGEKEVDAANMVVQKTTILGGYLSVQALAGFPDGGSAAGKKVLRGSTAVESCEKEVSVALISHAVGRSGSPRDCRGETGRQCHLHRLVGTIILERRWHDHRRRLGSGDATWGRGAG
jgi:hypothetical protein